MIIKVWANRLIAGSKKWDDVPIIRRNLVQKELQARLENGEITQDIYDSIIN